MATNSSTQTRPAQIAAQPTPPEACAYFQSLLGRLAALGGGADAPRTLGITSCAPRAGVSTVAIHLAQAAVRQTLGQQTLLIDANLERPGLHDLFGVQSGRGLAGVLAAGEPWNDSVVGLSEPGLFLMPAGAKGSVLSMLPHRAGMIDLLSELQGRFDLVIVDLPPLGQPGLTMPLAGLLDGVLLVVEAQRLHRDVASRAKEALQQAGARLVGVALNKERYAPRGA